MIAKYHWANSIKIFLILLASSYITSVTAEEQTEYMINPGDLLEISVWKEDALQREVRVLPDGSISFPLAGYFQVSGKTVRQIHEELSKKLSKYISDPVVNIAVGQTDGNVVYVIGQVKSPGKFIMFQPMDMMQILSLAGGLTTFASANNIQLLRKTPEGPIAIEFEYGELEDGDDLDKNYRLQSGDVIVVP